jgi:16S rRNA (cytidine1402-2'-O)-methyltransferase
MPLTPSCLYVVAVPLGHPQDLTLRAVEVLGAVDAVVCESRREGQTLLKRLGLTKDLLELNEHNESRAAVAAMVQRLQAGQTLALISDAGTPVFSDPGHRLIRAAAQVQVPIVPVPGPSSLMAALSVCDFKIERFWLEAFLPRLKDERRQALEKMRAAQVPLVLMDAPYRLAQLLGEVAEVFGPQQAVILACDLTLSTEQVYRGAVAAVIKQAGEEKREFVLVLRV